MADPLSEVVALLQPGAAHVKIVTAAGRWQGRQPFAGHPFFCAVLDGACSVTFDGLAPLTIRQGDFLLMPLNPGFSMASLPRKRGQAATAAAQPGQYGAKHFGDARAPVDVRLLGGYFVFGSPDAALLVSLLPQLVHVHGEERLATLVKLVGDESRQHRPARDAITARLLEVLLLEALRSSPVTQASPGLLQGLADARLAAALRQMHEAPAHPWTVAALARQAALSRSAFFERFNRAVGVAPMAYLHDWRMALAKDLLRRGQGRMADIAERVGYASASAFSTAFTRHVGMPPTRYATVAAAA